MAEKTPRVLVDIKLNVSQLCTLAAKVSSILGCIRKVERSDLSPLLGTGEAHLDHYGQFRAPPYERDTNTGVSLAKDC